MRYNCTICLLLFGLLMCNFSLQSQCEITSVGLSNVYCNDNATPLDTLDDLIIFTVQPTGNNISNSYNISVSSGNLNSSTGQYNVPKVFFLQQGSAGGGDISITITDTGDSLCNNEAVLTDPGQCSSLCDVEQINFTELVCHDNGTATNPFDDYLSYKITPEGSNTANSFFVEVSMGNVNPIFGSYGVQSTHTMQAGSAGNGDFYLSISDNNDINCLLDTLITDPGNCSPVCELLTINLDSIACNDNNSPAIPEDDYISFTLNPTGFNVSDYYYLTVSEGTVMPDSAAFGVNTTFQFSPTTTNPGNITISITDQSTSVCSLDTILMNPGSCSPDCMIFDAGLTELNCNDNNTDSTDVDDYISFKLNPVGSSNNGNFYILSVSSGNVAPSIGAFGQTSSFVMQFGSAGGGDVILTIKDMSDNTCLITTVIQDPGSCSTLCEIVDPQFNNLVCNDNGTNDVPIDDFLEFSLDPVGIELSTSYFVSLDTGAIIPEFAPYDTASYFTLYSGSATQDSIELHVQDSLMPSCFYDLAIISPGTCSPECKILDANLDTILCNNNGTPSDVSDDRIEFTMAPHGYNLNKNYTVIVSSGTIMPTMGAFEKDQLFNLQAGSAGNGDVIVKVKDIFDQTCPLDVEINDPGTCSPDCEIFQVQLADVQCNNNNTLADFTDDFLSFSLTPDGFNIDDSYILGVSQGSIVPNTALFGETTSFALQMGSAGAGDVTITIYNASDSLCFTEVVVTDPGSCSPNCAISHLQLADLMCHDNETAHDTLDDYLSFSLTPIGFNIGSKYTIEISEGSISPDTGFYNQTATFELSIGSAGSGDKVISLTDVDDPTCITQLLIYDPGHCSDICLITENNLTNITCNDNGTSTDSSDDFLSFSLKPLGGNTAGSYNIFSDSIQLSPETGVFGEQMDFTLENGSAGIGNQMISIVDLVDTNCVFMFELVDPGSCSPDCEIVNFGLENVFCNDNNTGSDSSDDYISFQIKPFGFNTGESFNLGVSFGSVEPDTGIFNVLKEYKISAGSAGAGDIEVILSSAQDSMCQLSFVVENPGTCSPQCEILDAVISDIVCHDNGTSANNTDDYLSFSMALEGFNLEGEYILSSSIGQISPNLLSFDGVEDFVLSEGTAGAGDIEITITNTNDGSCVFMQLIPNTGDCSNDCLINNTTVENLHCEDNNTSDDPTDDFISFSINPKGFNVSDSFKISTLNWAVSPNSGKYGVPGNYSLSPGSAGTGLNLLRIVDAQDTLCFKNVLLTNPGSCSEECNMVSSELGSVMCNDNETPTDSLDDYISFELNPSGYNLDGEYLLFSMNGIVVPSSGSYNEVTLFKLQEGSAGKGDVNILVIDANDNDCEIMVDLEDPGPCSDLSATVDFSNKWNIVCYPNPVSSAVFLDGLPENARIEIRNIIGKMVFSSTEVETNSSIDFSNWSSGLYMLTVYQGREQIFAEKLIKQ